LCSVTELITQSVDLVVLTKALFALMNTYICTVCV